MTTLFLVTLYLLSDAHNKLGAIKVLRALTGLGLKDSKEMLEREFMRESEFTNVLTSNGVGVSVLLSYSQMQTLLSYMADSQLCLGKFPFGVVEVKPYPMPQAKLNFVTIAETERQNAAKYVKTFA